MGKIEKLIRKAKATVDWYPDEVPLATATGVRFNYASGDSFLSKLESKCAGIFSRKELSQLNAKDFTVVKNTIETYLNEKYPNQNFSNFRLEGEGERLKDQIKWHKTPEVRVDIETQFEKGETFEQFLAKIAGPVAALVGVPLHIAGAMTTIGQEVGARSPADDQESLADHE